MSDREIADRVGAEVAAPRTPVAQLERLERTISEAEGHVAAQETVIAEAALIGRDVARANFELQKMQLLVAILREGRTRLLDRHA